LDPRFKKLPRGTSITTSTSGGSRDALEAMSGLRFSSVMPQTYRDRRNSGDAMPVFREQPMRGRRFIT
jgi:hypothetical protein